VGAERTELFSDERGRVLRATWHPDETTVTLSIWRESECVASIRLDVDSASRLSTLLIEAWADGLRLQLDNP
jgi:hypothetical protein